MDSNNSLGSAHLSEGAGEDKSLPRVDMKSLWRELQERVLALGWGLG